MNYRDFFKKQSPKLEGKSLLPEGVTEAEYKKGFQLEMTNVNDPYVARNLALRNLREDAQYYSKITEHIEDGDCGCDDEESENEYPMAGGALAVPHHGQPIRLGKIIQVGGEFSTGKPATGELSGMTSIGGDDAGVAKDGTPVDAFQEGDKEPITAGGKKVDSSIASKTVGGNVVPGEGQKQGGLNSKGTIAGTHKLNENKEKIRKIVKEILKEIRFDKETGKWVMINEGKKVCPKCGKPDCDCMDENTVNMKMGPSYKTVQPNLTHTAEMDKARTNQYEPEITEMYDDEEECMMNERYAELVNAQRNLSESELAEMKSLSEKLDKMAERNFGDSQGGVEPSLYETDKWIQKAVNPKHKGYCTPMTKSTCTPHRKAFAMRAKHHDLEENEVNMKMGPSYKTVQPTLAKTSEDDFARTNEYDPQVSEGEDKKKVDEAGLGAVQHSSYRTVDHGNLPQNGKQRWENDLDEGEESKVTKTIKKGQQGKKTLKNPKLKHQQPQKTTSGVHKRKSE